MGAEQGGLGDLGELYVALSPRLKRIVGLDVRAPSAVIEDACQSAWGHLVRDREGIRRDAALAWLATTATREALMFLRRQSRCYSLEGTVERAGEAALQDSVPGAEDVWEQRQRLEEIRVLPQRQQQMLWLHGLGYSYAEIATITGASLRTVERQLLRAKREMRARG
jgi:RNA polymerase sigma factor (sigma-70 family)